MALAGVATVGLPLGVLDQQSRKLPTIGFLGSVTPSVWRSWVGAFLQRPNDLGWVEGRTVAAIA
jgi:hypothetical protein